MMPETDHTGSEIRASLIRGGGILPPLTEAERERKPSLWLYLASLIATLATLYAINYSVDQESFGMLTVGVALAGYTVSYYLRTYRQSWQALTLPLAVCLALVVFFVASTEGGLQMFVPQEIATDRQRWIQIGLLWLILFGTFALTSDALLLFLTVPCVALIALIATNVVESVVFYAFLVFIGATTFLMIHENYLRSQTERVLGQTPTQETRLFRGQVLLAGMCVLGAVILGQVLAVPMQWVGKALYESTGAKKVASQIISAEQKVAALNPTGEQDRLEIATGPTTETDTLVMEVQSPVKAYWRGTTFDYYDGHSFQHSNRDTNNLPPTETLDATKSGKPQSATDLQNYGSEALNVFKIPPRVEEEVDEPLKNGREVVQSFRVVSGSFTQIYGAGTIEKLKIGYNTLTQGKGGGLSVPASFPLNAQYEVTTRVANDDPALLQKASSNPQQLPPAISRNYLGKGFALSDLEAYVARETQGLTNNYDKVMALKAALARDCKYSLQAPKSPPELDVVQNFVMNTKVGYCDSFAAALTMLCRYASIPARLATGYLPEPPGADGKYPIKDKDKHAWTEVYFPKVGWVTFDATEGTEDISDHSGTQNLAKQGFWGWLKSRNRLSLGVFSLILALIGVLIYNEIIPRLRGENRDEQKALATHNLQITTAYLKLMKALSRQGLPRATSQTPDEYAVFVQERLFAKSPEFVRRFHAFTETLNRYRYGGTLADDTTVQRTKQEVADLLNLLKTLDLKTNPTKTKGQRV